jgi:hypothetical protein
MTGSRDPGVEGGVARKKNDVAQTQGLCEDSLPLSLASFQLSHPAGAGESKTSPLPNGCNLPSYSTTPSAAVDIVIAFLRLCLLYLKLCHSIYCHFSRCLTGAKGPDR